MKKLDTVKNHTLKKKIIIAISIIVIIAIVAITLINFITKNQIKNAEKIEAQKEAENKVELNVEIKEETETAYQCLLTFISNDENDKIKSIQYPDDESEPYTIYNNGNKKKIAVDYNINKGDEIKTFKITTMQGEEYDKKTGYTITYDGNGGTVQGEKKNGIIGYNVDIDSTIAEKEGYEFYGWSKNKDDVIAMYEDGRYIYDENNRNDNVKLYAILRKKVDLNNDDLLKATKEIKETCQAKITINDENYEADFINYDTSLVLDGKSNINGAVLNNNIYEFGTKRIDVATKEKYARNMVILKVNGDLTINEDVTLTACKSDNGYGGPKGLLIYCTGTITNNGTIDMTARGAKAEGQNVYLWKNNDNNYEYIPAVCSEGGNKVYSSTDGVNMGLKGENGLNRGTGGGGSGAARHWIDRSGSSGKGRNRYILFWRLWRRRK